MLWSVHRRAANDTKPAKFLNIRTIVVAGNLVPLHALYEPQVLQHHGVLACHHDVMYVTSACGATITGGSGQTNSGLDGIKRNNIGFDPMH